MKVSHLILVLSYDKSPHIRFAFPENVSDNTPPMQPTGEARKAQPIRGMEADIASREVCRNAKRGTPCKETPFLPYLIGINSFFLFSVDVALWGL